MMFFDFDCHANKAHANLKKHDVSFRLATSVFRDPLALTVFDDEHCDDEERLGHDWARAERAAAGGGPYQRRVSATALHIRIISARRADPAEVRDFEQAPR